MTPERDLHGGSDRHHRENQPGKRDVRAAVGSRYGDILPAEGHGVAPATWTGTVNLAGDALLEFASGEIDSIATGAQLTLNGAQSRGFVFPVGSLFRLRVSHHLGRATFPAPASSNAACGFPALRSPVCFASRLMGPILPERLSALVEPLGSH